jgi:hypothetical protein
MITLGWGFGPLQLLIVTHTHADVCGSKKIDQVDTIKRGAICPEKSAIASYLFCNNFKN